MKLLILAALKDEIKRVIKYYKAETIFDDKKQALYKNEINSNIIYLGITGVGKNNVEKFLNHYAKIEQNPDIIVSSGFAGALDTSLRVGDIVVADYYICNNKKYNFNPHFRCENVKYNLCTGIGVDKIFTSSEKLDLKEKYKDAYFIDMESCATIRFCEKNHIELIIVRAISDTLNFKFPEFKFITKSKKNLTYWLKIVPNFTKLVALRYNIFKAKKSLYKTLRDLIERMNNVENK